MIERYKFFTDDKLLEIITKEADDLEVEALEGLIDEIIERELSFPDSLNLNSMLTERKQNREKGNAWLDAFHLKKNGATDQELIEFLIGLEIKEIEIDLILKRLPKTEGETFSFNHFLSKKCDAAWAKQFYSLCAIFLIFISTFVLWVKQDYYPFLILSAISFVGGFYSYSKNKGSFKDQKYWLSLMKNHPEDFVWIKPITVKTTLGFVLTINVENHFEIFLKNNTSIRLNCSGILENKKFLEGVRHYLPHVHFGYSREVNEIFSHSAYKFTEELKSQNLYTPIDVYMISEEEK